MGLQKVFSLVIALHALKAVRSQDVTQGITWGPCNLNPNATASIPLTCGTLAVPLDYTNPDSTTLNLNLVKVDAVKQPARSSILFNPGGPGASGREYVAGSAEELLLGTGGEFDLIGFDPRYVHSLRCFNYNSALLWGRRCRSTDHCIEALRTPYLSLASLILRVEQLII